jgi:hypothetical protein
VTATAYTAVGVILAGCGAYAWDVLDGRGRVSTAIRRGRRKTARPERTRT